MMDIRETNREAIREAIREAEDILLPDGEDAGQTILSDKANGSI